MTRMKLAALAAALALPFAALAEDAGTFKIPGTNTTLKLNGYVQFDATFDVSGRIGDIENWDWASIVAAQPLDGTADGEKVGQLYFTARTTRVGLSTTTPTDAGAVGTRIEGDFNGPNGFQGQTFTNSVVFRLRHAYGTFGNLLVGQTWTNFLDLASYPDTVDFNGPGSIALIRQPQIRYTFGLPSNLGLTLALENPRNGQVGRYIPDVTAALSTSGKWGTAALRLMTNQYRVNGDGTGAPKQGFGGALSGSFKVGGDTLVAHVVGGQGLGRYLFNGLANFWGDNAAGEFTLWQALAYHVGYTHNWNATVRSNLVFSQAFFGENGIVVGVDGWSGLENNKSVTQAFLNTFWSFAKNAEFGIEYAYGLRHTYAAVNANGRENRINASVHYNIY
jgi:DcaP outer membrane protein